MPENTKNSSSSPNVYFFACLMLLMLQTKADTCVYNEDGTGLLNSYHELYIDGKCYPCPIQCKICDTVQDLSCSGGNCEDYYFYNQTSLSCQPCSSLCKKCRGPLLSQCQVCMDGYYFEQSTKICKKCPFGSNSCDGTMVSSCFSKYYLDLQSFSCRKCGSNCLSCDSQTVCRHCDEGYYLTQDASCVQCGIANCSTCLSLSTCFTCKQGYQLNNEGNCQPGACLQDSCLSCPNNSSICTYCKDQYFLMNEKCFYGSSLVCSSGINGSSYGKCQTCVSNLSFTNLNNPSYCLLSKYPDQTIDYQFMTFSSLFLCLNPLWLTNSVLKSSQITIEIEPLYRMDVQVKLVSQSKSLQINIQDQVSSQNYIKLNSTFKKTDGFYCQESKLSNITSQLFVHRIHESFNVNSLSSQLKLIVSDSSNSSEVYLNQILITKYLCLVQNCQACLTKDLCTHCQQNYFLEEYECKTACSVGYYTDKQNQKCVYECDKGFYINTEQSTCERCKLECLTCSSENLCTECLDGYFIYLNTCVKACPDNTTYPSIQTKQCSKCENPCQTCLNSGSNCTSCLTGYLNDSKCVSSCNEPYFENFVDGKAICSLCSTECKSCSLNADHCESCFQNLNLFNGKCINQCQTGYYSSKGLIQQNTLQCFACHPTCKACEKLSSNCTICNLGYLISLSFAELSYLNASIYNQEVANLFIILNSSQAKVQNSSYPAGSCLSKCPDLYFYENSSLKICQKCSEYCKKCQSLSICQICENNRFLQNGKCLVNCTSNEKYMNPKTNQCENCRIPCKTCVTDSSGSNCLSCQSGYFQFMNQTNISQISSNLSIIKCVLRCPQGYYINRVNSKCQSCNQNCTSCSSLDKCLACKQGYFLLDNYSCSLEPKCSEGFYMSNMTNSCKKCKSNCKKCQKQDYFCTQCKESNLFLLVQEGLCLEQCPEGYVSISITNENQDSSSNNSDYQGNICQACPSNCSSCVSLQVCLQCQNSLKLFQGKCIQDCPVGYFYLKHFQGQTCRPCSKKCNRCLSQLVCLQCDSEFYLIQNECQDQCADGYYIQKTVNSQNKMAYSCEKCPESCQTCLTAQNCSSCASGYFLGKIDSANTLLGCKKTCLQGQYKNLASRKCEECKYPCKTCTNGMVCLSCQDNLTLLNQNCVQNCPQTFYFTKQSQSTDSTCLSCVSPCYTCRSEAECISCKQSYFLLESGSKCVLLCPDGYFQNLISRKCQICQKPCRTCNDKNRCQTCIEGYYLKNNLCLSICPKETYLNNKTFTCENCSQHCRHCKNGSTCQLCVNNFKLLQISSTLSGFSEQICVQNCPEGNYDNKNSNACEGCDQNCKTCIKNKRTCTSCHQSYFLLRNLCVKECPSFYFGNQISGFCQPCNKWCESCQNGSQCQKCNFGFLFKGKCVPQCPDGYYENKQSKQCTKCMTGCQICGNQFVCQKCNNAEGFVLYFTRCIESPCPSGYYKFVEENKCVEKCPYLINRISDQCYLDSCPIDLVLSASGTQCQQTCLQGQFVAKQNGIIKCKSKTYLQSKSIDENQLPQFGLSVMQQFPGTLKIHVLFSYAVFEDITWNQISEMFSFEIEKHESFVLQSQYNQSSSYVQTSLSLEAQNDIGFSLLSSKGENEIAFDIQEGTVSANVFSFVLKLKDEIHGFDQPFLVTAKMKNPYKGLSQQIKGQWFPVQNYKATAQFLYLNYSQQKSNYLGIKVISWLLISLTVIIAAIVSYLSKSQSLYLLANIVEYFQILFFLSFLSINLPPLLDSLLFSFRFTAGHLILSSWFDSSLGFEQLMVSPWQYYKYTQDIHLFKNLSDIFILFGIIVICIIVSKLLNKFTKILHSYTKAVIKYKTLIIQLYLWLFMPFIGLFALINIFYSPTSNKYLNQLQSQALYKIIAYVLSISFFGCIIYFSYQFHFQKTRFDKGVNELKKKLGVGIPLYRFVRKTFFVLFLTSYYDNSIYAVCIFLLSTAIIFILIFWYEPYKNPFRQLLAVIEEGSLAIFFSQILIFMLNPDYYVWISPIILTHSYLHCILLLIYPSFYCYNIIKLEINPQNMEKDGQPQTSEISISQTQKQKGKVAFKSQDHQKDQNESVSTKMNFGTIIRKKIEEDIHANDAISAHEADQSDQGQIVKKNFVNNVIRLAKKPTKKSKQFKNYDFSSEEQDENESNPGSMARKDNSNKKQFDFYKRKN